MQFTMNLSTNFLICFPRRTRQRECGADSAGPMLTFGKRPDFLTGHAGQPRDFADSLCLS